MGGSCKSRKGRKREQKREHSVREGGMLGEAEESGAPSEGIAETTAGFAERSQARDKLAKHPGEWKVRDGGRGRGEGEQPVGGGCCEVAKYPAGRQVQGGGGVELGA